MRDWSQQDFRDKSQYPMALGSVFGVRWWSLDRSGLLKGVYGSWMPEVNEAECRLPPIQRPTRTSAAFRAWAKGAGPTVLPDLDVSDVDEPDDGESHVAPVTECSCGFYAFWEAEPAPVHAQFPAAGVIEGFGRTVIGSRGFRCQKARILALHVPVTDDADGETLTLVSEVEEALSERYVVPVYATMRLMLLRHPPTTDYSG